MTIPKQLSLTNSLQGIMWRLGYGIDDPDTPEGKILLFNPILVGYLMLN